MANLVAMLRLPSNLKSTQWQILAGPILILLILSMMVLPLPAFILDLLFTFNIALSIMVLLVAMFTQRTLEFAAFPTILLFTTLLRLALNVASTRIILMDHSLPLLFTLTRYHSPQRHAHQQQQQERQRP